MFFKGDIPVSAIYTFGQPPFGSESAVNFAINPNCIPPSRFVRMTSGGDLAPWANVGSETRHSEFVDEVYAPEPLAPGLFQRCDGGMDGRCSASVACEKKTMRDHSRFAGFDMSDPRRLARGE